MQGTSEKQTRTGALEENLILLQCGHDDSYFMSAVWPDGTPMAGLFNLVQLTLLFHAEHMLSQEWSSWEGPERC